MAEYFFLIIAVSLLDFRDLLFLRLLRKQKTKNPKITMDGIHTESTIVTTKVLVSVFSSKK